MRTLEEIRAFLKDDRFAFDMCGICIDAIGDGTAECSMPLTANHLNANGVAQGGAIFTLADICFTVAANATEPMTVSHSADIHYLRPGSGSCLYATAQRINDSRSTALYRVDVMNDQHKLVAYATITGFHVQR